MIDDTTLLRQYAASGAEEAFAALVRRNVDLVYATALRIAGDTARAEDVAQSVIVALGSIRMGSGLKPFNPRS